MDNNVVIIDIGWEAVKSMAKKDDARLWIPDERVREYEESLANRIRSMREERGLKRDWVAKQIGIHYNTLKNWELGKFRPGARDLLALSEVYHVKPEEFFIGL